ncbi:MAG: mechanosensitive ion channel family protein [Nitrososphaerota archaeon]|nr:mechanosensitive ion channel family protein [Nitrososphaerota archaeon]MDG6939172.1 mechanosensitive ion channel family protein [Nitrososphaerota archaeon]
MAEGYRRLVRYVAVVAALLVAMGILLYSSVYVFNLLPVRFSVLLDMAAAAVAGYVAIRIISKEITQVAGRLVGKKRASSVSVLFRYLAYALLALVILSLAGVSGSALLAGGTFAGLVIGLAAQTVLSNVLAGILLILARPFETGDRVTLNTWQYGMVAPVYPPKYFSDDRLFPGYTGVVKDIGLTYTLLELDEGPTLKIPNSVAVGAAVMQHGVRERVVRVRYQSPASVPLDALLPALEDAVKKNEWVVRQDSVRVYVQYVGAEYSVVAIDAVCRGEMEDPPRSSIYVDVARAVEKLKQRKG